MWSHTSRVSALTGRSVRRPYPSSTHCMAALLCAQVRTLSIAFCASVACGNIALSYIYVSFAQMVSAASPLFTIALMYTMGGKVSSHMPQPQRPPPRLQAPCARGRIGAVAVALTHSLPAPSTPANTPVRPVPPTPAQRYTPSAYASMVPMCGGVMLCTAGELNFNLIGFVAVVSSTLLRGVKSIIQGRLLTAPEEKFDSLTLLYHMSWYAWDSPFALFPTCGWLILADTD